MSLLEKASLIVTPNAYKTSKLYSIKPTDGSGDMNVVRATTATRVNADGLIESVGINVPRLDYSGGGCPSILVEPQRTNLLTYSEQFDNASWSKAFSGTGLIPVVTSNIGLSPSGTNTADRVILNKGNGTSDSDYSMITVSFTTLTNLDYTNSFFLKSFDGTPQTVRVWSINLANFIDITLGSEWVRVSRTSLPQGTYGFIRFGLRGSTNQNADVLVWGAQLEAGANATSYIPTVASSVTRNAEGISKTGISDLIGQTEGTLYAEFSTKNITSGVKRILGIKSSNNQNIIALRIINNGNLGATVVSNGSIIYNNQVNVSLTNNTFFKISATYTNTRIKMFVNGILVLESGVVNFSPNELLSILALGISEQNLATEIIDGNIKNSFIFKTALTDEQCINLTTI